MKLYSDKLGASIKMLTDEDFNKILNRIIEKENIQFVFESGTYLGTGSTTTIANLFVGNNKKPLNFITVEANLQYFETAKKNLARFSFITPVFGLSTDYFEAVKFLVNDDIFNNLDNYPNIFIDHAETPQKLYLIEILVGLFQAKSEKEVQNTTRKLFAKKIKSENTFNNNVAAEVLSGIKDQTSLIILDSAAGIGFFEFLHVKKLMTNKKYYIVLDDIDHLKHYRSKEYIQNHPEEFEVLGLNESSGWLVAKSLANSNKRQSC